MLLKTEDIFNPEKLCLFIDTPRAEHPRAILTSVLSFINREHNNIFSLTPDCMILEVKEECLENLEKAIQEFGSMYCEQINSFNLDLKFNIYGVIKLTRQRYLIARGHLATVEPDIFDGIQAMTSYNFVYDKLLT